MRRASKRATRTKIAGNVQDLPRRNGKPPLRDVPPWNYGSLRGLEAAGFVAVPRCPHKPNYQEVILRNIADEGIELSVVRDTPWVRIMTWSRASQDNT